MGKLEKIVVGGVPEHFNLPWHNGIESGAFSDTGIDLQYVDFPGGTGAMTKALRASELDVAIALTEGCVADILNGNPSRIVQAYVTSPLLWGIHVADGSEIEQIDQINGKRYAISRYGSGSHLMAIVDAAQRGWSTESMQFVVVKNLAGAREALASDEADVFFWERFTSSPFVANGEFRRLDVRETPWPAFVVCVRQQVLEQCGKSISRMLDVVNEQCRQLMESSSAIKTIADRYDLDLDQVKQWFSMTQWSTVSTEPVEKLDLAISFLKKLNLVPDREHGLNDVWQDVNA